ncbi:hypothetical protein ABEF95_003470 [Exophiala dermatitidis]
MPVSTRRSTYGAAPTADSAEAVTAILNDEAGGEPSPRRSERKRKRTSNVAEDSPSTPSNKHVAVEIPSNSHSNPGPSEATEGTRRGLKARVSLAAPIIAPRGDLFDFPGDANAPTDQGRSSEPEKKKLRRLRSAKQPQPSPFKGRGVLEIRSTAHVNLDASPARPRARDPLRKIAKSMQRVRRPGPVDAAPEAEEGIPSSVSEQEEVHPLQDVPTQSSASEPIGARRTSPRKPRPATVEDAGDTTPEASDPDDSANIPVSQSQQQSTAPTQQTQATSLGSNEEQQLETSNENQVVANGALDDTSGIINESTPCQPDSTAGRPETEVERRTREREEAQAEAKRQQRIKDALKGIESAVKVFGCEREWQTALVGGLELDDGMSMRGATSTLGREAEAALKKLRREYKKRAGQSPPPPHESARVIGETLVVLEERCKELRKRTENQGRPEDSRRHTVIRDVYGSLIHRSLSLNKAALKAHFQDGRLSISAQKVVLDLLRITSLLLETATRWQSRPTLENTAKRIVRHDIQPNISTIMVRYKTSIMDAERKKRAEEIAAQQELEAQAAAAHAEQVLEQRMADYHRFKESLGRGPGGGTSASPSRILAHINGSQVDGPSPPARSTYPPQDLDAQSAEAHAEQVLTERMAEYKRFKASLEWGSGSGTSASRRLANVNSSHVDVPNPPARSTYPPEKPIVDVDDLDLSDEPGMDGDDVEVAGPLANHILSSLGDAVEGAAPRRRPQLQRETTEEIPPPRPVQWEESEIRLLVKGLRKYRDENSRFEDIVEDYGAPGRGLEKYDMDEIVAQARWIKQHMAKHLRRTRHDPEWDWLRSVPD